MYLKKPIWMALAGEDQSAVSFFDTLRVIGIFDYGGKEGIMALCQSHEGGPEAGVMLRETTVVTLEDDRQMSMAQLIEDVQAADRFVQTARAVRVTKAPMSLFAAWLLAGLFVVLVTLGTVVVSQEAEPTGTIATEASPQQDADIAERIREILKELGGFEDVTVAVSEGIVTVRGTTATNAEVSEIASIVARIEGVVALKNEVVETRDLAERLNPAMERFMARLTQLLTFMPILLIAAAVFAVVVFVGYVLSSWRRPWDRLAPNRFIADLYRQLVQIAFVIGGLVIALDILDATALLSTILGAAGIIGLAFGFAVRDTVENYIASIMLSIRQPFRPNDTVEINGDEGKVIRLTSRATILLSFDGNHIRIPNATVFKSRIVNYSQNAERRFLFVVGVDWDADSEAARALATRTVQDLPFVLSEPAALAWIDGITEGGIQISVTGWVNQHDTSIARAKGEALRQVKLALEGAGIALPDTTYQIRVDGGFRAERPVVQAERPKTLGRQATAPVATVDTSGEAALDKIIDAERHDEMAEDLLSENAEKE